jgi:GntR family transcriptional regulator
MNIDRFDNEKLYIQLTDILLSKIHSGEWQTGSQIPTEEDLCRSFDVSKITVRRAINNLAVEGYLEKLQGKGTFVRQVPQRSGIPMKTILVEGVFQAEEGHQIKVIGNEVFPLYDEEVMSRLGPVFDRDIFYLSRLQVAQGVPVLVNELYIPVTVCPAIREWNPDSGYVFDFLKKNSTPKITRVNQTIEVGKPGPMSGHLNIRTGGSCMIIHRVFTASGGATVVYSKTTARGDRFKLNSEFARLH